MTARLEELNYFLLPNCTGRERAFGQIPFFEKKIFNFDLLQPPAPPPQKIRNWLKVPTPLPARPPTIVTPPTIPNVAPETLFRGAWKRRRLSDQVIMVACLVSYYDLKWSVYLPVNSNFVFKSLNLITEELKFFWLRCDWMTYMWIYLDI